MTDNEFERACEEIARLADIVAQGTPEQIREYAISGWWDAMDTLRRVYNDWIMTGA
jgi:hypothetical protein